MNDGHIYKLLYIPQQLVNTTKERSTQNVVVVRRNYTYHDRITRHGYWVGVVEKWA